ncbi:MAG: RecX family transcriptional regulator [Bacteroidaceae bacterium]|nr:RecX family transcriptional regulator [Bacteroidaceae bacterium]
METVFQAMAACCARKECTIREIREKLLKKELSESEIEKVIKRLIDEHYIDEQRYANAYIHDKTLYESWGFQKSRQALRLKGVPAQYIQEAIENFPMEQYLEVLHKVIRSKQRTIKGKTPYETKQKLARSIITKGFEPHLVFEHLDLDLTMSD